MLIEVKGRFHAGAERPQQPTVSPEGLFSCTGTRGASMTVDLRLMQMSLQGPEPIPYPVDWVHSFFIPSTAIHCVLADQTAVQCVGKFDVTDQANPQIRIDAVDQERHSSLWIEFSIRA